MKINFLVLFLFLPLTITISQHESQVAVKINSQENLINAVIYNNNRYFSLIEFCNHASIDHSGESDAAARIEFKKADLLFTAGNPFVIVRRKIDNKTATLQFPISPLLIKGQIYLPVSYGLEILSRAWEKEILYDSSDVIIIGNNIYSTGFLDKLYKENFSDLNIFSKNEPAVVKDISVNRKAGGIAVKIHSEREIPSYKSFYRDGSFTLLLKDTQIGFEPSEIKIVNLIKNVYTRNVGKNSELKFDLNFDYNFSDVSRLSGTNDLVVRINVQPDLSDWFKTESENFIAVYRESHSSLVPHLLRSAESSLKLLMKLFNYTPSEKIIINTYDVNDYGFGAATTVPQNYIRIEIEPLEPGYENTPYNERFQWLLSHELVHIVVNDQASGIESLSRTLFAKVAPEQVQPITVFYSLLTNYSRYTPRWHQEAIAVFFETWMSGGFGRVLGNFDEMYFRTMVLDGIDFPGHVTLEAKTTHNSFLLETLFYLYGGRFASYLAINYGSQKLIDWFITSPGSFYGSFTGKFKKVFGVDFDKAWKDFINAEIQFQKENIEELKSVPISGIKRIKDEPFGWTTQPYFDPATESILFGYHKPSHLSSVMKLDLYNLSTENIGSLPTPSQFSVASTAFDYDTGLFFYTTNNNQLYRDVCVLDIETGDTKVLFKDSRIGHLTVSPVTHELWGIKHSGGKATLIYSPYPYNTIEQVVEFAVGDEVPQLSVSPSGKYLAASLLKPDGEQSIILTECERLLSGKEFTFKNITSSGSPENPSWSSDEKFLFWNAYTNGVSNIYRIEINNGNPVSSMPAAVSHTLRGLFKPVYLNNDLLFAFEFTTEGFIPVIIQNKLVNAMAAINYLGQEVIKQNYEVYNWYVQPYYEAGSLSFTSEEKEYSGLANLNIQTFIPVISGFQKQKMLGVFTHISDPLLIHDLTMEIGYSPFNENPVGPKFHFKGKYEYKKQFEIGVDHNAPDFYDLFNERKRGLIGTKVKLGHTHYWIYDNPLKMKQQSEIAVYKNIEFINDNLVRVSEPDFIVAQTNFNSKDLRRTIGSSDFEHGNEFNVTLMLFAANPDRYEYAGQLFGEWDHYLAYLFPHNVFHFKVAAGYHKKNDDLFQARFFFGGFGNRALENVDVKQYRKVFRFPGIPIYSLDAEHFLKMMIENNLPSLRFSNASVGHHFLNHIDFAVYSQFLYTKSPLGEKWIDLGAQINFIFKHWFNLESTLSAGIANAWFEGGESWEWFVSFKLLRN